MTVDELYQRWALGRTPEHFAPLQEQGWRTCFVPKHEIVPENIADKELASGAIFENDELRIFVTSTLINDTAVLHLWLSSKNNEISESDFAPFKNYFLDGKEITGKGIMFTPTGKKVLHLFCDDPPVYQGEIEDFLKDETRLIPEFAGFDGVQICFAYDPLDQELIVVGTAFGKQNARKMLASLDERFVYRTFIKSSRPDPNEFSRWIKSCGISKAWMETKGSEALKKAIDIFNQKEGSDYGSRLRKEGMVYSDPSFCKKDSACSINNGSACSINNS